VSEINLNAKLRGKVLLVEDEETNQMLMSMILSHLDLKVDLAKNGLEAVDMFKESKYDLILMDENMPQMNGMEATKVILDIEKEQNLQHTPIVALTGNALEGDRDKFIDAGMDEFISKPIDRQNLTEVLHSFLKPL